ncbi:MAG: phosphoribosylanthranilate isomerase, partial [Gelidibacter sp.]|nr:phosphoribosylanthranilate isomerase [Gelidibacter sp.]
QIEIPEGIKKVGVFVNETIDEVLKKVVDYQLDCVQLHGNESIEYCQILRHSELVSESFEIIKAFSVDDEFDFSKINKYQRDCDYFLFDTKGKNHGGNGIKFNWELLQKYSGKTPFLLSGGITKNEVEEIKKLKHPAFFGIDINSGFELEPGLKNIKEIKEFKNRLL